MTSHSGARACVCVCVCVCVFVCVCANPLRKSRVTVPGQVNSSHKSSAARSYLLIQCIYVYLMCCTGKYFYTSNIDIANTVMEACLTRLRFSLAFGSFTCAASKKVVPGGVLCKHQSEGLDAQSGFSAILDGRLQN